MDLEGQLVIEYLLVFGFSIIVLVLISQALINENELNQAIAAARIGSLEGAVLDGLALYPDESFAQYNKGNPIILNPSSVKITRIDYDNQGFHEKYRKIKIQLHIHASAIPIPDENDRNILGERINFYARKKISLSFRTENLTNTLYNPAFSQNYVFTTSDVEWDI